jgi:uncharacterized protein YbbC (DUF1343 family)
MIVAARWQARAGIALLALLFSTCARDAGGGQKPVARAPSPSAYHPPPAPETAPAPAATVATRPLHDAGIRFVIEAALRRSELPGCVLAVGDRAGLRYLQAFGERSAGEPMTIDTRFDLASLTKPLATAAAIMLLAEQGALQLDAPAARYLPELELPDKRAITLEQLLLHTSGLPKVSPLSAFEQGRAHAITQIARAPLLSAPGARFEYSDLGFILLGEIVQRVAGKGLDQFARERLFTPLGMRDSDFRPPPEQASRCAPTELRDDVVIRGVVDDPRAYRLGGVAGHAGLFSTAQDLARFAQMLLRGGELDGVRVLAPESVARLLTPRRAGGALRTLGFDVRSSYALARGQLMSARALGHGGYTGTSLWLDPERDLFVVLLSNRVHVGPKGSIHPLASALADLALRASSRADTAPGAPPKLGIDVLEEEAFARLRGRNVALLTHLPARDAKGTPSLQALARAPGVKLSSVLSPEHGLGASAEGKVADSRVLGVPVHSLFGHNRKPSAAMLSGCDTIVVDLVDVGTRFFTYMASLLATLETAGELGIDVVLLDRPNPIDGVHVEGPLSEAAYHSFVNYHPLPLRHGMTAGELARLLIAQRGLATRLHVVQVEGWRRSDLFEQTGLTWQPPSPNLPTPRSALLYPAVGLIEGTNLSVGRGTPRAFSVVGAPYIDGPQLAAAIAAHAAPGVRVSSAQFRPQVGPFARQLLPGVAFELTDPAAFSATRLGFALIAALRASYPQAWDSTRLGLLLGRAETLRLLLEGAPLEVALKSAARDLEGFQVARAQALLPEE